MAGDTHSSQPLSDRRHQVSFSEPIGSISRRRVTLSDTGSTSSLDEVEPKATSGRFDAPTKYLWGRLLRRTKYDCTSAHADVFEHCRVYLLAYVLSGRAGDKSTPWPEGPKTRMWLSDTMGRVWTEMAIRVGNREGRMNEGVAALPFPEEARRVQEFSRFGSLTDYYPASRRLRRLAWPRCVEGEEYRCKFLPLAKVHNA